MNKEEQVMNGLWDLFKKRIWLDEFKMKDCLKGYTPSEVHCIEYIEKNIDSNVTKLAESFYMTRSAISKLTKKLIEKELIESYQKSDNKKEIYFRPTDKGKEICKVHEKLHREFQERDKIIFDQVTEQQYDIILNFIKKYNIHLDTEIKKLDVDIKSKSFDKL